MSGDTATRTPGVAAGAPPASGFTVLAIDLGTGGPKVAIVGADGVLHAVTFEPAPDTLVAGGGVEHDPEDWWHAVAAACRRVVQAAPGVRVDAVAITGQWGGTGAVGPDGRTLGPALSWMDARGAPHVRRMAGGPLRIAGYGPWSIWRWLRLTGGAPSLGGRDPLGHTLYLRHERPDVYAAAACLLEPVDLLGLRLTGRAATTATTATLQWVTDTRDLRRIAYAPALVRRAGIDPAKLPEILPTGSVLGPLTVEAAADTGLPAGTPVIAGTPDAMACAIGAGTVDDAAAHLYIGTSSWLSCHVPFKRTDPLHSVATLPSALPDRYLVACEQQTSGRALQWLRDALAPGSGDEGYVELVELAAAVAPGADGLLFAPWLNGERTPVDDHRLRGAFTGLSLEHGRGHLARAVLEGVALNARWMQTYVERLVRRRLDPVRLIGGGARSALWCQILADVLDRPIDQVADPVNAGVRGAALHAAIARGALRVEDVPARVPVERRFTPDPRTRAIYDERYAELRREYRAARRRSRGRR